MSKFSKEYTAFPKWGFRKIKHKKSKWISWLICLLLAQYTKWLKKEELGSQCFENSRSFRGPCVHESLILLARLRNMKSHKKPGKKSITSKCNLRKIRCGRRWRNFCGSKKLPTYSWIPEIRKSGRSWVDEYSVLNIGIDETKKRSWNWCTYFALVLPLPFEESGKRHRKKKRFRHK